MTKEGIDLEVWYCSDESIRGEMDRGFGSKVKWDIPLLQGYKYAFFKNYSLIPSIYRGFWGLMNLGMLLTLFKKPKSIVLVHGWSSFTVIAAIVCAKLAGHSIWIRGESPLNQELSKSRLNILAKRIFLQVFLFSLIDKFLYIGKQNQAFYEYFGVKQSMFIFTPYAVDNLRFQKAAIELLPQKSQILQKLGLPSKVKIILFSGKFIHKKRPLDLLQAYKMLIDKAGSERSSPHLQPEDLFLILVGEGELRLEMEQYINYYNLKNVRLTGFINQSEIVNYYSIADVFVMCSGQGETWGLSVNEAMNFRLPLVISDTTGCATDLVLENVNGFIHKTDDPEDLMRKIINALQLDKNISLDLIDKYSYKEIIKNLLSQLSL